MKHPGEFMLEDCAATVAILRFAFGFIFTPFVRYACFEKKAKAS